jgi:hypothetical protein
VTIFRLTSADFCFLPPLLRLWVEPAGGERKFANVEWKTVMLIYPYPTLSTAEPQLPGLKTLGSGKHSSLVQESVIYNRKSFVTLVSCSEKKSFVHSPTQK